MLFWEKKKNMQDSSAECSRPGADPIIKTGPPGPATIHSSSLHWLQNVHYLGHAKQ